MIIIIDTAVLRDTVEGFIVCCILQAQMGLKLGTFRRTFRVMSLFEKHNNQQHIITTQTQTPRPRVSSALCGVKWGKVPLVAWGVKCPLWCQVGQSALGGLGCQVPLVVSLALKCQVAGVNHVTPGDTYGPQRQRTTHNAE